MVPHENPISTYQDDESSPTRNEACHFEEKIDEEVEKPAGGGQPGVNSCCCRCSCSEGKGNEDGGSKSPASSL